MKLDSRANMLFDILLLLSVVVCATLELMNPLRYVPDDALFYYQIAFNILEGKGISFSLMPTNGFHPLWEIVCVLVAWLSPSRNAFQYLIALTALGFTSAGLMMLRLVMKRIYIPYPSAFILLGAPYLLFVAQGMEGNLTTFLVCAILVTFQKYSIENKLSRLFLLYSLFGLLVLARLDLAIILAPVSLYIAIRHLQIRHSWTGAGEVVVAATLGMAPVLLYLLVNSIYFGDPRPISGLLKLVSASHNKNLNGIVILYLVSACTGSLLSLLDGTDWSKFIFAFAIGMVLYTFYILRLTSESFPWYFFCFSIIAVCAIGTAARVIASGIHGASGVILFAPRKSLTLIFAIATCIFGSFLCSRYGSYSDLSPIEAYTGENDLGRSARREGVSHVLVFDRPGELAFLQRLDVLAVDGLTTNLPFQKALIEHGVNWAITIYNIQALVIPRLGARYTARLCGDKYVNAIQFQCVGSDPKRIFRVDFFSRLTGEFIGSLNLDDRPRLVFTPSRDLEVVLLQ